MPSRSSETKKIALRPTFPRQGLAPKYKEAILNKTVLKSGHTEPKGADDQSPERKNHQYSLQRLQDNNFEVVMMMKNEIVEMRRLYGKRINNEFLSQIEERVIVFVEDGSDLKELKIGVTEGSEVFQNFLKKGSDQRNNIDVGSSEKVISWKNFPKQVALNVNKYIAKYNFEIARKLSGVFYKETKEDGRQKWFSQKAMLELL